MNNNTRLKTLKTPTSTLKNSTHNEYGFLYYQKSDIWRLERSNREKELLIANISKHTQELTTSLEEARKHSSGQDMVIADRENTILVLTNRLKKIEGSILWRLVSPFMRILDLLNVCYSLFIAGILSLLRHGPAATYVSYKKWRHQRILDHKAGQKSKNDVNVPDPSNMELRYSHWRMKNFIDLGMENGMRNAMKKWNFMPKFSILMSVCNTEEVYLRKAINSVLDQIYPEWEFCIYDNASSHKIVGNILHEYQLKDKRIKINKGISKLNSVESYNQALLMSTGDFILMLNPNDELTQDALWKSAELIQHKADVALIYSDHDEIDTGVRHFHPKFKPDWSPELILSYDYVGPFKVFSSRILKDTGFLDAKYMNSCTYDLVLRIKEITQKIQHIPDVLYHSRIQPHDLQFLENCHEDQQYGKLALENHLDRLGIDAKVEIPKFAKFHDLSVFSIKFPQKNDKISIIIPTKDKYELISCCIDSILQTTDYPNYEIIVVDSGSLDDRVLHYYEKLGSKITLLKVVQDRFSFAYVNNMAAKEATGDFIVFLNNDTEVIEKDWLTQMRGVFTLDSKVGGVGSKLLYQNNTLQHAGVVLGLHNTADHAFRELPNYGEDLGYMLFPHVMRNYSACTAACLMVKKDYFNEVGGFDERLALAYNDVDLCLKLGRNGYRIVYNPNVALYHYEMSTRTLGEYPGETNYLCKKWGNLINQDPYYNPHLTKRNNSFLMKEYNE